MNPGLWHVTGVITNSKWYQVGLAKSTHSQHLGLCLSLQWMQPSGHAQPHTSRFTYRRSAFFNTLKSKTVY